MPREIFHVSPRGDLRPHVTHGYAEGKRCWCTPEVEENEYGTLIVIHNSMDRREEYETGERKPS